MKRVQEPETLTEAVVYFANPDNCLDYLAAHRWPHGEAICPRCGSNDVGFIASRRVWQCKTRHPLSQFSIKVGTIFEDSPLGLDKWLPAMWMIASNRNGISSGELHRALGVTKKTGWFMLHRIRLAMQDEGQGSKLGGEIEADGTFIGGKARNMHKDVTAVGSKRVAVMARPLLPPSFNVMEPSAPMWCRIVKRKPSKTMCASTSNRIQSLH